jgi:hypothetical protein
VDTFEGVAERDEFGGSFSDLGIGIGAGHDAASGEQAGEPADDLSAAPRDA